MNSKKKIKRIIEHKGKTTVFVETGTYKGTTLGAVCNIFDRLYSIELNKNLHKDAVKKFRKHKHISLIHGDSAEKLKDVVKDIDKPIFFWLDGHYSGGITSRGTTPTPVLKEIACILERKNPEDVIAVDDIRVFTREKDWPNISEIEEMVKDKKIILVDDIMFIEEI